MANLKYILIIISKKWNKAAYKIIHLWETYIQ